MAETFVQVPPQSTGLKIRTEEVTANAQTVEMQVVVVGDPTTAANLASVSATGAVKVDASATTQPVSGSVTAVQATGTNLHVVVDSAPSTAVTGTVAASQSGTWTVQPGNTANTTAWKVDGSAVTQPISGSVTANIGTSGSLALDATLTGGTQKSKLVDTGGTNVASVSAGGALKVDGSAVTQPVSLTSTTVTGTVAVTESGTWTVQPGNTANTTPWLVTLNPAVSGGLTTFHLASAASTNATSVKASAGQLYGYMVANTSAAFSYLCFHNTAGTPTAGASIFFKIGIPAGGAANVSWEQGVAFGTGIGISTVTGAADNNSTAVAVNDLIINLFYK
jgi:hypothetical protein